jgi:ribosomal protein S18 acetylase RimI-like enzyme
MPPLDPVRIEAATLADLDAIVRLWMEMMREHESFDSRVRLADKADDAYRQYAHYYIERGDAGIFVARLKLGGTLLSREEIGGFCLSYRARNLPMFRPANYGFISDLTVLRRYRHRGIGRALLEAVRTWFRRQGVTHIQLQVYDRNAPGIAFWKSQGFDEFVHGMWLNINP